MTDRKYTPAQRRALMALTGEWKSNPAGATSSECHKLAAWHPDIGERTKTCPGDKGVWMWRLTPAGLAEKERSGNDRMGFVKDGKMPRVQVQLVLDKTRPC